MILDYENLFSNAQAITATAASTNIIDLGSAEDAAIGEPIKIEAVIPTAFNTLTSLTFAIQSATDAAFTTPVTHSSTVVALAQLTAGARVALPAVAQGFNRYLRLYYTVTGSNPSTGTITAGVVADRQSWQPVAGNQF